jgi:hypothetical protein
MQGILYSRKAARGKSVNCSCDCIAGYIPEETLEDRRDIVGYLIEISDCGNAAINQGLRKPSSPGSAKF